MLDLNFLRKEMARYMADENSRGSVDAALFHVLKMAYSQGLKDGRAELAAKDAEIAELKASLVKLNEENLDLEEQLAAAHQEIAALKGDAEPVAWMDIITRENGLIFHFDIANAQMAFDLADGKHNLYLHPPTEDEC